MLLYSKLFIIKSKKEDKQMGSDYYVEKQGIEFFFQQK